MFSLIVQPYYKKVVVKCYLFIIKITSVETDVLFLQFYNTDS